MYEYYSRSFECATGMIHNLEWIISHRAAGMKIA